MAKPHKDSIEYFRTETMAKSLGFKNYKEYKMASNKLLRI